MTAPLNKLKLSEIAYGSPFKQKITRNRFSQLVQVKVLNFWIFFLRRCNCTEEGREIEAKNDLEKLFLFPPQKNVNSAQFAGERIFTSVVADFHHLLQHRGCNSPQKIFPSLQNTKTSDARMDLHSASAARLR